MKLTFKWADEFGTVNSSMLAMFIVLKLTGVVAWSWIWVLCPFWIPVIIAVVLVAIKYAKLRAKA